jgi:hypothetical protein
VNNTGDISWHKHRIFISEVFSLEELAFELITPGFYRVFFRDMEIGELNVEELRFRATQGWSEFAYGVHGSVVASSESKLPKKPT